MCVLFQISIFNPGRTQPDHDTQAGTVKTPKDQFIDKCTFALADALSYTFDANMTKFKIITCRNQAIQYSCNRMIFKIQYPNLPDYFGTDVLLSQEGRLLEVSVQF